MTTGGSLTWAFKDERDSVPIVSSSEGNSVIIASTLEDLVHALKDRKEGRGVTYYFRRDREGDTTYEKIELIYAFGRNLTKSVASTSLSFS